MFSRKKGSGRTLPEPGDRRTSTVIKDEEGGIAFLQETNQELVDEYQKLLFEYQRLKQNYEEVEVKYQETQKEKVKVTRHMELNSEKFTREKGGLVKQKDDLNTQNEKLHKELREKSGKIGDLQKVLVEAQKKADARKEELLSSRSKVDKLEILISELQNKVIPEVKQKLNKSEANKEVFEKRCAQLDQELRQAEEQHDNDEEEKEKLRKEKEIVLEMKVTAERNVKKAEDDLEKAKEQIYSLHNTEKTLRDKNEKLDSDLHSAKERIRELEDDLNRRIAEPELKTYNVNVVESAPALESAPPGFSFGVDVGLSNENESLRKKVLELNDRVKLLEDDNYELKGKLDAANKEITKWKNKYEDEKKETTKKAAELENEKGNYDRLKNDYNDLKSHLHKAERTIENDKKEIERRDTTIDKLKTKILQLDEQIDVHEDTIAKLESKLEEVNEDMDGLRETNMKYLKRYGDLDSDYKVSVKEKESVQKDFDEVIRKMEKMESKLKESDQQIDHLVKVNADLNQKLLRLEDDFDTTNKDKTVFQNQVQDWADKTNKQRKMSENMKKKLAQAQEEAEQYKNELAEKNNKIDELNDKLSHLESNYETSQSDLLSATGLCDFKDSEIKSLDDDLDKKKKDISYLEAQLEKVKKEKENAEVQVASLLEKMHHMEPKRSSDAIQPVDVSYSYSAPTLDFETDLAPFRQKIYELENENNRLINVEEHLQSDLKNGEDKIASLQRDLHRINVENEDWEKRAAQMKKQINDLEKQEEDLMDAKKDLEDELEYLKPQVEKLEKKVDMLTLERDKYKECLLDSNAKLTQSKEDFSNKDLDFSEQVKVNSTLGKTVQKHVATVESLTQKCKELEEDLENLRPQLKAALARNETLEDENKKLDYRNKDQKREIDELKEKVREEEEENEKLQLELDSKDYKLDAADNTNKVLTKQKKDLINEVNELNTKLRKLKPELEQTRNKLKEKDRIISRLESELKEKDSQLNAYKRKISTLEDTVTSSRKEIEALKSANEINRNRVKELQTQLKEMGNNMQTVANVSVVQSAPPVSFRDERLRSNPDERVHDLETLLKKSEAREDQLREQLLHSENRLRQADADAKKARHKAIEDQPNVHTQRKLEETLKTLERCNREKEDAKKEAKEARTDKTILLTKAEEDTNKIISLETLLAQTERRLKETQDKLLAIDEEHVHLRLDLDKVEKEKEDRHAAVGRLQGKKTDLETKVELLESRLKSTQDNCGKLKEEKTQFVKQLNDLERITLAELRRNLTRMQGERDRALEDLKAVSANAEDLENQLADAQAKREEVEKDNDDLEAKIRHLQENEIEPNRKTILDREEKIEVLNLELQRDEKDIDELKETKNRLEDEIADLQVKLAEKHDIIEISPMNVATVDTQYAAAPGFDFGADPDALSKLEYENMDLKEQMKREEMENDILRGQLSDYKTKLGDSEGKNHRLETNLKDAEHRINELEKKLPEAIDELNQMNDKYQSAERELELLKDELQDAHNELSNADAEKDAALAKMKLLQQQLEAAQQDLLDKNDDVIEKQRKINELYAILESGDKDSDRLKQVIEELREDVDSKDRENTKLLRDLRLAENNIAKLQADMDDMEAKYHDTVHEREEYKMKVDGLNVEIEMRDRALEEAQSQVDDARDKLKAAKKEIDALRSQLKDANVNLKAANDEKKILEARIAELQKIIEQLRKELGAKSTVVSTKSGVSDEYLNDLRNKLAEYRQKYQDVSNEKMELELKLREKDVKISQVSGPSESFREERDRLKDEIINLQATNKETKRNLQKAQRDIEELQRRLVSKDSEIQRLEDKIRKLENEKEKLKKDYANLEKKNSDLKVEYEKLKYGKNKAENDLSLLKKKFQALQNQFNAVDIPKQNQDVVSRKKYQELEASCQDALREKEKAKSDMAAYRTKMARLETEVNEQKREKDRLEDEVNRLRNGEAELKKNLQTSRDKHKEDKNKALEWRKNNYAPLEQELQKAKGQIKKLEKSNATKEEEIDDLKDDLADRDKRIAELMDELDQDDTDAGPLDSVNIDIRGDSQALQNALDEKADAMKELQRLMGQVETLKHDTDIYKTKFDQQETMVREVNKMNDNLKEELRQLKKGQQGPDHKLQQEIRELSYQVNTLKEDNDELEKDLEELRKELNEVNGENRKLMMANKELTLDQQHLEVKLQQLEMGHKLAKDDNEKIRNDLLKFQNENDALKDSLNNQNDMIQVQTVAEVESAPTMFFDDDVDGIKRDKDKLQIELEAAEDEAKRLQNELKDMQIVNIRLQDELSEVKKRLKEGEAENNRMDKEFEDLRHELTLANQNNDDLRNDMENLEESKVKVQAENDDLKDEYKNLEQQLQKLKKEKADLERELKRAGDAPIVKRRFSRDLHNEKERKIRELGEKVAEQEREIQMGGSLMSSLKDENEELHNKNKILREDNKELHGKLTKLENDYKLKEKENKDLEKENEYLQDMVGSGKDGTDPEKETQLMREIDTLNDRNNKLQKNLDQAKQDKNDLKRQLDEYNSRFDYNNKQLAVQITALYGGQSEVYKKEIEEKDGKIEMLQQEKMEIAMELERLREECDAAKSSLTDLQKRNDEIQKDNKTLKDDNTKLDNKLMEEMNYNKVKTAELEAEQDILKSKIKDKDDLVKKYEKQLHQLREQLATSVPSDQASTTLIVERKPSWREHKRLSYQEGLMNKPGIYRSTSENSLPNGDVSRSSDLEHSQLGEILSKDLSHGRRMRTSEPRDHVGEKIDVVESKPIESEPDYTSLLKPRSSTPVDEDDKKSGGRESESSRYGAGRDQGSTRDRDRDRDRGSSYRARSSYSTRDRDRDRDQERRQSSDKDSGKEHKRADCQQS